MTSYEPTSPATVGFMDIGTNSIRLMVVRIYANHSYTIIRQLKETVRLGEAEFANHRLRPESIDRAVAIIAQFAVLARAAGAGEIVAVATAATREADNRRVFIQRVRDEAGIDVHVVSGMEEARLIFLGVTSGVQLNGRTALCVDIGGGSTELGVGTAGGQYSYLNSLKLGAIRLTNRFLSDQLGPVPPRLYQHICRLVRNESARSLSELRLHRFNLALGSSGTIENLADIASRMFRNRPAQRDETLSLTDLKLLVTALCALSVEQRRNVPGMSPMRADIIIGGAAILETLMDGLSIREIQVSERGLRDGLLVDYLRRGGHSDLVEGRSVRERSVLQLGRACQFNEAHAFATAALALSLFDAARDLNLHRLGSNERELLKYAALIHHIGTFLTYNNYQKHSAYMVRNAELLGFDQAEIEMVAMTALYHRNAVPRKRDPEFAELTPVQQESVRAMSMFLRLAESLDRSQAGVVDSVRLEQLSSQRIILHVAAKHGWEI
ncbi:MAG TPA: Ppx/GppA phosphatase family protein, partial [Dehalococcoidia bacterium]|nr:Ppx/GppA phosphatase family protein [Dehalococcoidia bacterium]